MAQFVAMNYWLVKSEPSTYSFDRLVKEGTACWDGVRNFAARLHLRGMRKGDAVLFYESGDIKSVVGQATVTREHYPDPTAPGEDWSAVDLKAGKSLATPVSLAQIKATKSLKDIPLLKISRLSVMPMPKAAFETIVKMGLR